MTRIASLALVASFVACSSANSFPAPRGKPKTIEEQLVGRWVAVTSWGQAPKQNTEYEFTPDGNVIVMSAGKPNRTHFHNVGEKRTIPIYHEYFRTWGECQIRTISTRELVVEFDGDETKRTVLRRIR